VKQRLQRESVYRACAFQLKKINAGVSPVSLPEDWLDLSLQELRERAKNSLSSLEGPRVIASVLNDLQARLEELKRGHDPKGAKRLIQDLRFLAAINLNLFSRWMVRALPYFKTDDGMPDLFFPLVISMHIQDRRVPLVAKRLFELEGQEMAVSPDGAEILFYRKLMQLENPESLVPSEKLQKFFSQLSKYHWNLGYSMTPEEAAIFYAEITDEERDSFGRSTSPEVLNWAKLWHFDLAAEYLKMERKLWYRQLKAASQKRVQNKPKKKSQSKPKAK